MSETDTRPSLYQQAKLLGWTGGYVSISKNEFIEFINNNKQMINEDKNVNPLKLPTGRPSHKIKEENKTRRQKPKEEKEKTGVPKEYNYPSNYAKKDGTHGAGRKVVKYAKTDIVKPRKRDDILEIVKDYKAGMQIKELLEKHKIGIQKLYKILAEQGIKTYHYGKQKVMKEDK